MAYDQVVPNFTLAPTLSERTLEQELADPTSLKSLEMYNALINHERWLAELKRERLRYALSLQAQEAAEKAQEEEEEAASKKKEEQNALNQSLEKYHAEQAKIMAQIAQTHTSFDLYGLLMNTLSGFQSQIGVVAAQLYQTKVQAQLAAAHYAQTAAKQQAAEQAYLKSYFDTVYQTPIRVGEQTFTMDLNQDFYRNQLSPAQLQTFIMDRQEAAQNASASPSPAMALSLLQRMSMQQPQAAEEEHTLERRRAIHTYQRDIRMLVPIQRELKTWLLAYESNTQDLALRQTIHSEYKNEMGFAKHLWKLSCRADIVEARCRKMEEADNEMMRAREKLKVLKIKESALETLHHQQTHSMHQLLKQIANFARVHNQHETADLAAQLSGEERPIARAELAARGATLRR
ncbi:MAG: hypothetical protein K0S27_1056 [Gammaproteobacteria bacterium]|jgi:hypothetical protein|nr:hypothetical protein [Gammaproteobacteria bacterium]